VRAKPQLLGSRRLSARTLERSERAVSSIGTRVPRITGEKTTDVTIAIAGSGGDGVVAAGEVLVSAAASQGLSCFLLKSFGAQIRGGESSCRVRLDAEQVLSQGDVLDVVCVLSWADYFKFESEMDLAEDVVFIEDSDDPYTGPKPYDTLPDATVYRLPFGKLAREDVGQAVTKNMVLLGILAELFAFPFDALRHAVARQFGRKAQHVVELNWKALQVGALYVRENVSKSDPVRLEFVRTAPRLVMSGNEAIAYGALYAGCRFYAGYPITPSSEIMHWLSEWLPKFGGVCVQAEDEMSALGMVIGASFSGLKALTSSSGPGISLMSELIGLASVAEIPCVIVNCQRVGPSTGIPTKTEQADLQQALYGTHGDAQRVVMAPADVEDCFDTAVLAFYVAEKYQIPVIILSDQFIAQRVECIGRERIAAGHGFAMRTERSKPRPGEFKAGSFERYALTPSGVSPMSLPGIPGAEFQISGLSHNERGRPTSQVELNKLQAEKRWRKLRAIGDELHYVRHYGPDDARLGIMAWGSSKGAVKEAVLKLNAAGIKVKAIVPQILSPIPKKSFERFAHGVERAVVVELSQSAQFLRYLRAFLDLPCELIPCNRAGGYPWSVREITTKVLEVMGR
jgi:2-oxoglutarate ferredoxin oxidoreductase subunit alpha